MLCSQLGHTNTTPQQQQVPPVCQNQPQKTKQPNIRRWDARMSLTYVQPENGVTSLSQMIVTACAGQLLAPCRQHTQPQIPPDTFTYYHYLSRTSPITNRQHPKTGFAVRQGWLMSGPRSQGATSQQPREGRPCTHRAGTPLLTPNCCNAAPLTHSCTKQPAVATLQEFSRQAPALYTPSH